MKTILITGASAGIGRAAALGFLDAGWKVGLLARREEPLRAVTEGNANALALPADVTDAASVAAAFDTFCDWAGRIDVLFNNAGVGSFSTTIDEIPVETWLNVVAINLTGSFLCARAAFRAMREQTPQGGRIINNGSISAHAPRPGSVPYTSTKHAITGLTKSLSLDGRPFDICASQIDIGNALTEMAQAMTTGMPQPDGSVRPEAVMDVRHVASSVLHMANLPLDANVQFMTVMAPKMPFIGRG
jgi:NAD(P)-dependent dehydrogenase (short-subunit alcohol dehydrogenase family)